ncbi:Hsp33 family molecular chaperone HslO [Pseudostreptobacillus hongkongensis]|uniref:Hsp33 family molecular chaperone HslO n=1 Tax=Pseudostreptobacillus hongkongensis TaxID=1162717 RepID=UPI0028D31E02|nr:Hsp33 family molecular chaperone HslO [Pseudostreptobacillus hongkongensis]
MILRGVSKSLKFEILDTTNLVKEVINHTNLDVMYTERVAKLSTLAAILAQDIKSSNTRSSITLKTKGALKNIIAKTTINSNVAVKVDVDSEKHEELIKAISNDNKEKIKELYNLDGSTLQIMVDYGLKTPYTSLFVIEDNLLELAMNEYFERSEQTKSILVCSVKYNEDMSVAKSSGLLIQLLPDGDEEVLNFVGNKLTRLTSITDMLYNNFSLERIAHLIFENDIEIFENEDKYKGLPYDKLPMIEDIKILEITDVNYECDCNDTYMKRALTTSISEKEIDEIITEDGFIEIECSFCGKKYRYNSLSEVY